MWYEYMTCCIIQMRLFCECDCVDFFRMITHFLCMLFHFNSYIISLQSIKKISNLLHFCIFFFNFIQIFFHYFLHCRGEFGLTEQVICMLFSCRLNDFLFWKSCIFHIFMFFCQLIFHNIFPLSKLTWYWRLYI